MRRSTSHKKRSKSPKRHKKKHESKQREEEEEAEEPDLLEEELELVRTTFESADARRLGRITEHQLAVALHQLIVAGRGVIAFPPAEDGGNSLKETTVQSSAILDTEVANVMKQRSVRSLLTALPARRVIDKVDIGGVPNVQGVVGEMARADFFSLVGRQVRDSVGVVCFVGMFLHVSAWLCCFQLLFSQSCCCHIIHKHTCTV